MLIAFNKPWGVLCQFTAEDGKRTLADYIKVPGVYAAGRLDLDSEGLLLLTDDGSLQHRIAHPQAKLVKTYRAQLEGIPSETALEQLRQGVQMKDGRTRPAAARIIAEPAGLWPRDPPIRVRREIPDTWLELRISEGKNRQVRRMTAAVGYPTLRLIRAAIGALSLDQLQLAPGQWKEVNPAALSEIRK